MGGPIVLNIAQVFPLPVLGVWIKEGWGLLSVQSYNNYDHHIHSTSRAKSEVWDPHI